MRLNLEVQILKKTQNFRINEKNRQKKERLKIISKTHKRNYRAGIF